MNIEMTKKDINSVLAFIGMLTTITIPAGIVIGIIGITQIINNHDYNLVITAIIIIAISIIIRVITEKSFNWYKDSSLKIEKSKLIYKYQLPTLKGYVTYKIGKIKDIKENKNKIIITGDITYTSQLGYGTRHVKQCDIFVSSKSKNDVMNYIERFKG